MCMVVGCSRVAVEVDHRVPRTEGGTDDPDNLVSLCREDHYLRHAGIELQLRPSTVMATAESGSGPWVA